jgi:transcriptional regulator with XRE-family HTH domain
MVIGNFIVGKEADTMKIDNQKLDLLMAINCLSAEQLANITGVSQVSIARFRKGIQRPRPSTIGKIAKALGVTVQELIETEAATSNQFNKDSESNHN